MFKRMIALAIGLFSLSCFAVPPCPSALPTTHPGFCASFATAASCYCSNTLPKKMCQDVGQVYNLMIARYGSVEIACKFQRDTTYQTCIDDWHCYRIGGKDSQGGLCSGTGKHC